MAQPVTKSAKTETSKVESAETDKQKAIQNVKDNWTFTPVKANQGKYGLCITLLDDVVLEFKHPKTKETIRVDLKKELNENYTAPAFSHSDARFGRVQTDDDGEFKSAQLRVHNSCIE